MIVRITRVKVGNRQAPQQQTETPPKKVGFLRLRAQKTPRRLRIITHRANVIRAKTNPSHGPYFGPTRHVSDASRTLRYHVDITRTHWPARGTGNEACRQDPPVGIAAFFGIIFSIATVTLVQRYLPHRGALCQLPVGAVSMIGIFIGDRSFCKLWGGRT